jgi:hypothetical protein
MNDSIFHTLCTKLCMAAGTPVPNLNPDPSGNTVLSVTVDEIEVVLIHEPQRNANDALLSVAFGQLPAKHTLQACHALMEINSLMLWSRACSFGLDPKSGSIVLQYGFPLKSPAHELYDCILTLADVARAWRETQFVTEPGVSLIGPLIAALDCA